MSKLLLDSIHFLLNFVQPVLQRGHGGFFFPRLYFQRGRMLSQFFFYGCKFLDSPRAPFQVRPELIHIFGELLDAGVIAEDIAVIAPYAAQVRLLREQLSVPGLEIDSVDGFQGREKEAVVISLVRSNPQGEIGFLADIRRMNVAMTRARRKLLMVGDSATLSGHPFYRRAFEYFESLGAYRTVWEEDGVL